MGEYRLSRQARHQIGEIGRFTQKRFGSYQAKAYHAGLERTFGLLSDFPKIGANASEVLSGARRFRFQSHLIFYSEEEGYILIRAVIHAAQDLRPELFQLGATLSFMPSPRRSREGRSGCRAPHSSTPSSVAGRRCTRSLPTRRGSASTISNS